MEEVKRLKYADEIILNGHFCIFDKNNDVIQLSLDTYYKLGIKGIILLEKEVANKVAESMHIPLYIYKMKFNDEDIKEIRHILNRVRRMEG